jgi:hypothetical protein
MLSGQVVGPRRRCYKLHEQERCCPDSLPAAPSWVVQEAVLIRVSEAAPFPLAKKREDRRSGSQDEMLRDHAFRQRL